MLNSSVFYFISLKSSSPQNKHSLKSAKNSVFNQKYLIRQIRNWAWGSMSPLGTLTGFSTQCCRHKPLTAHKVFRFHTSSEYRPVPPPAESERLSICLPPQKNRDSRCFNRWESSQVPLAWDKHSSVPIPYQHCEVYRVLVCRLYSFLSFYYCSALDGCCQRVAVLFSFACHWVVRQ